MFLRKEIINRVPSFKCADGKWVPDCWDSCEFCAKKNEPNNEESLIKWRILTSWEAVSYQSNQEILILSRGKNETGKWWRWAQWWGEFKKLCGFWRKTVSRLRWLLTTRRRKKVQILILIVLVVCFHCIKVESPFHFTLPLLTRRPMNRNMKTNPRLHALPPPFPIMDSLLSLLSFRIPSRLKNLNHSNFLQPTPLIPHLPLLTPPNPSVLTRCSPSEGRIPAQ